MREFVKPVMKAKDAGLKVTIHTGEDTPASFVKEVIELTSPDRIGHGIHAIEDMNVVELIKKRGITLEVNPWSNYLTNSVRTIEEHPLKKLFDLGVKVTINSDDPEVLETNLNNEYRIAHEVLGMSMDEIAVCNRNAYEASFYLEKRKFVAGRKMVYGNVSMKLWSRKCESSTGERRNLVQAFWIARASKLRMW